MSEILALRSYQADAISAVRRGWSEGTRRLAVVLPTGSGKTVVFAHLAQQMHQRGVRTLVLAHRDELIEQAAAKLHAVAPGLRVGIVKARRREIDNSDVIVASVQSLIRDRARAELAATGIRLVIVDECFPAGTMVGDQRIEDIRVGDLVPSWDEDRGEAVYREVVRVMRRAPSAMVSLTFEDGATLACTPEHPLLTDRGWCAADRTRGAFVLTARRLPDARSTSRLGDGLRRVLGLGDPDRQAEGRRVAPLGAHLLLDAVSRRLGVAGRCRSDGSDEPTVCGGADDRAQSDAGSRRGGPDETQPETDRSSPVGSRGEWRAGRRTAAATRGRSRLADRGGGRAARWRTALPLPRGYRAPDDDGCGRGRRWLARLAGTPGIGRPQGRTPGRARVVDVQVLQPGRNGTYGGVCRDGVVYNLEVEFTHTYLVGESGFVAHNCHHAVAASYVRVLEDLGCFADGGLEDGAAALGVTATLGRADKLALGDVWQDVAYSRDILDMIREGYLVNAKGIRIRIDGLDLSTVARSRGDWRDGALAEALHDTLAPQAVAKAYLEHAAERAGIVFTPTVALAHEMAEVFTGAGMVTEAVDGVMPLHERREVLARFARGEVQVIANCAVLTEGFDAPWCSAVVIARPTSSAPLFIQMAGRALRPYPGKRDAVILDVAGATGKHRLASVVDLAGAARAEKIPTHLLDAYGEIDLFGLGEAADGAGRWPLPPGVDGPITSEIVDLFGTRRQAWLRTERGVWFLDCEDTLVFLTPGAEPGSYDVARCAKRDRGGEFLQRGVDLDMAMSWGEQYAEGTYAASKKASWRRAAPSEAQRNLARSLGADEVDLAAMATRGDASDFIGRVMATRRLDSLPVVATVTERGYW